MTKQSLKGVEVSAVLVKMGCKRMSQDARGRERRLDQERYIHFILLTSNTEKDQIIEGLATGADDYLTKPFHSGELLARVGVGRRVADEARTVGS